MHDACKASGDRLVRELSMRDFDEAMRMAEGITEASGASPPRSTRSSGDPA
jgi:hypothetical protein